jgi:hypothetical protein
MGHRDPNAIRKLCTNGVADGIDCISNIKTQECETTAKGKMTQLPFFQSETKTSKPLDLIHSDVWPCADDVSKWMSLHAD